ncbi:Na+/H+ antiporter NhaC family protein [Clostridium vitabionis]|jgi:Na+/H+ antiporter NhaC|uniref:Na+/H+ antiporter NhaC family protein n=1 Tax=Clostridium vitabionis TaxID=2784388 RepID=UPI00188C0034|nr:Na+/H+ antiporter NhaC family protein [Clostridium vitabionis]
MENSRKQRKPNGKALIPFLIFVGVYLATGVILNLQGVESAFYQLPTPIAAFVGIIAAFIMMKGTMEEKLHTFMEGCGDENIMTMCMIYIFAGAFTTVTKEMGGIDAAVNMGMAVIPPQFLAAGVFVISAFIALATGTSVGTIVSVTPITIGLAEAGGLNVHLIVGATIGGAMFGDNLSMISDTTIAATRTQGVEMKDKFRENFRIALPAAILTVVLLLAFGRPDTVPAVQGYPVDPIRILPYAFVLVSALLGMNVFMVLVGGILLSGAIGIFSGSFSLLGFANNIYQGFTSMFEIFLLSMVTGGLGAMVTGEGGLDWILEKVRGIIRGRKSAELGISAMVALTDFATANNTVAIIISAPVARDISETYGVDPKRTASLLDIFSCVVQGIIPYGAQVLYACALLENLGSPFQVVGCCWYSYLLMIAALISIAVSGKRKSAPQEAA